MKNKKPLIFLVLILLIGVVGGTFAYYSYSKSIDNEFVVGDFNVVIEETPSNEIELINQVSDINSLAPIDVGDTELVTSYDLIVDIANKENTAAVIRVSYNEYFKEMNSTHEEYGADESTYEIAHNLICSSSNNNSVTKNWTTEFSDYFIYHDGWYYYTKVLPANESITILNGISVADNCITAYEKYYLDFNLEAIQATPKAVKEILGNDITISERGDVDWDF